MPFDPEQISQKLQGYPPEVLEAFEIFSQEGKHEAFEAGLLGALGFLAEASDAEALRNATDSARLREDLNIDSLAMVELVFFLEDTFGITIQDDEIEAVRTVGDFKTLARQKLSLRPA